MVTKPGVSTWPTASDAKKFGDQEIIQTNYFKNRFSTGPTEVDKILV